jgi:hypothetical protein
MFHVPDKVVRVLVVADGLISFSAEVDPTDTYFTLTTFVNSLRAYHAGPFSILPLSISVTLANRDADQSEVTPPPALLDGTVVNAWFTWMGSPATPTGNTEVDLSNFDVIYLFGYDHDSTSFEGTAPNLCWDGAQNEDQLWAFVQFMNAGRGVFATGDHEDLGAALCGSIPRVRSMRRWWWDYSDANRDINPMTKSLIAPTQEGPFGGFNYGISFVFSAPIAHTANRSPYDGVSLGDLCSPPSVGPYRLDTVQPGPAGLEVVKDYFAKANETGVPFDRQSDGIPQPLTVTVQHPVLALSGGRYLSILPDHMHEGLVIGAGDVDGFGPMSATQTFEHGGVTIDEYPAVGGNQPLPQVIATELSLAHATPSSESAHIGALDVSTEIRHGAISVYDGTTVNVGRIVTQTSFHHFADLNLIGDPVTTAAGGTDRTGFTTPASAGYLADLEAYWANLTLWLAPQPLKLTILMVALDRARHNLSIRSVARKQMKASGHAVHDIGQMVVQFLDSRLTAPMLQDVIACSLEPEHRTTIAATLAHRRRAVPNAVRQIEGIYLNGFLGGAILHALELPPSTSLAADPDALRPAILSAGLHGAGRSLAVSQHRAIVPDLVEALHRFGG